MTLQIRYMLSDPGENFINIDSRGVSCFKFQPHEVFLVVTCDEEITPQKLLQEESDATCDKVEKLYVSNGQADHIPSNFFKGCLAQILLGPLLNTLSQTKICEDMKLEYICTQIDGLLEIITIFTKIALFSKI